MNARDERILIFGDSLTQHVSGGPPVWDVDEGSNRSSSAPGDLLASLLAEQGAKAVRTNAKVSRSAFNFWTVEQAPTLIANDIAWNPTKIIFVLGTNDAGLAETPDLAAFQQLKTAYAGSGAEIWAIGPFANTSKSPADVARVAKVMKAVFGSRFIDGRSISAFIQPGSDGLHYGPNAARALALNMTDALLSSNPRPWLPVAIGAAGVVGAAFVWSMWKSRRRNRGLGLVDVVDGKRYDGGQASLIRGGYRQVPCKSGLDRKGLARCWAR